MRTGRMKAYLLIALTVVVAFASTAAMAQEEARPPKIQMAILLDTSSSMRGLIEQAKAQLWTIVNEFATTRKDGKTPDFEVALYEYGKPGLGQETGYIRMILPLPLRRTYVARLFSLLTRSSRRN